MKHRRKNGQCPNCGLVHPTLHNYCPQCGQENTTSKVSFSTLLSDLFSNYLTFDSRSGRTVVPFLFRPGALTLAFNQGERLRYLHPVRLYILMNLFFFFVFDKSISVESLSLNDIVVNADGQLAITPGQNKGAVAVDPMLNIVDNDSVQRRLAKKMAPLEQLTGQALNAKVKVGNERVGQQWISFVRLIQDRKMTAETLLDSLAKYRIFINPSVEKGNATSITIARQLLKIGQRDLPLFLLNAISNIPTMMLVMLPFLAIYLRILYVRRRFFFIEHFIFSLHLQSFVYLVFGLTLLSWQASEKWHWGITEPILMAPQVILFAYVLGMFKRVFRQGWTKSFIKASFYTFCYFLTSLIFLVLELLYSFWMF